jgi:hypothetical protein
MGLNHSPKIVTSGLAFAYDMGNTAKSWKGAPVTNLVPNPYANWNGSTIVLNYNYDGSGGQTYTYVPNVPNPVGAPGVLQYVVGTTGYKYWSIASTIATTGTHTFSYYARIVNGPATTSNLSNAQLWRSNGVDQSVTGDWNPTYTTEWVRYTTTGPCTGGTVLDYFPIHSGGLAGGYTIQYCGFQLELGTYATPFVPGTRSNTQALLDLTGLDTITPNSLTYASNNTFSFNGSTDYMDVAGTSFVSGYSAYSICFWAKRTTGNRMPVAATSGTSFYWYGDNSWFYTHGGATGEYYYPKSVTIADNTWGFYCCTYDGANVKIYRNGTYEGQQASTGTANWSVGMRIGYWNGGSGYQWSGDIGSVMFYNKALTAAEVLQNFNAHRGRYGI